jgi:hypothetical protein
MLSVYEVTKILLGHGADGSVRRAYHRETGTHRSRPRRTGRRHPATGIQASRNYWVVDFPDPDPVTGKPPPNI